MKQLLLSATLLLFASNLTAQLHVSPNTTNSTDSYIYANDVVLYVEEDINLEVNNNVETKASIYLRGDSQLLQGTTSASTNSGNGYLSVWQRGTTNAYDYNYWASPVGNPENTQNGNVNFGINSIYDVLDDGANTLHKTNSEVQTTTWDLNGKYSDVINGGPVGTLQISRRWIYTMRAQSGYTNWIHVGDDDGIGNGLKAGEGFTMKGTGTDGEVGDEHDQLYDFRGRPNNGDITVQVAGTSNSDTQETLTGNPYPSALDMADLLDTENDKILANAYYWESDPAVNSHYIEVYQGGYGVWQPGGGTTIDPANGGGTTGIYTRATFIKYDGYGNPIGDSIGAGNHYERRFAPVGQGFMVRGIDNGMVTFKNSMRRHVARGAGTHSQFRGANRSSSNPSISTGAVQPPAAPYYEHPTVRFQVEINNLYVREMVLILSDETTTGEDRGWDSRHPSLVSSGDAYWKIENETNPFVIQSRPFDYMELIPLGLKVQSGSNTFKIKASEIHSFSSISEAQGTEVKMYLYDQLNNQYQPISTEQSAVINHNGDAGRIDDRYFIVYRRDVVNATVNPNKMMVKVDFFQNNPQSKLEVSNPDALDIKNASIYDMRGRLVLSENNIGKMSKFSFPTNNLSSGVYIVKLATEENGIIDYKITVHNK